MRRRKARCAMALEESSAGCCFTTALCSVMMRIIYYLLHLFTTESSCFSNWALRTCRAALSLLAASCHLLLAKEALAWLPVCPGLVCTLGTPPGKLDTSKRQRSSAKSVNGCIFLSIRTRHIRRMSGFPGARLGMSTAKLLNAQKMLDLSKIRWHQACSDLGLQGSC